MHFAFISGIVIKKFVERGENVRISFIKNRSLYSYPQTLNYRDYMSRAVEGVLTDELVYNLAVFFVLGLTFRQKPSCPRAANHITAVNQVSSPAYN